MRRGTSFIAGPPTGSPRPGLVTTPTPSPLSSSSPRSSLHETRAVRCAPCVTSGSSPASLTTTASAQERPTSHRSTLKEMRRSSPIPGSFKSTVSCGSPVRRAFAAALAAAAAQVPVVQPVLSFSPPTLCMLGGMAGSRSLRLGGIGLLLAEHVGEVRAVQVGARPALREAGTHQDERLPLYTGPPDTVGELLQRAPDGLLVRPARLVDDRARGIRGVAALEELLLQGARAGGGVDAGNLQILGHGPLVELAHPFQGDGGGLEDLRAGPGVLEDALVHEAAGPDHDVRLADEPRAAEGQEIGRPRSRPDKPD